MTMPYYYDRYKAKHDSIKPIRGRATEIRPIGERRKDWMSIEMDGDVVACRLYNTQVVRYYPDGRIGLRCGGWTTNTTADFMHEHSPFTVQRSYKNMWVSGPCGPDKSMLYLPMPSTQELILCPVGDMKGWAYEPYPMFRRVVDREKSKDERVALRPFLEWARVFLTLSDGWIMHETRKEARNYGSDTAAYIDARSGDEDKYLSVLCRILPEYVWGDHVVNKRKVGQEGRTDNYDIQFRHDNFKSIVETLMYKHADVYKVVPYTPSNKMATGVITSVT
jgi:hypothetical protein